LQGYLDKINLIPKILVGNAHPTLRRLKTCATKQVIVGGDVGRESF